MAVDRSQESCAEPPGTLQDKLLRPEETLREELGSSREGREEPEETPSNDAECSREARQAAQEPQKEVLRSSWEGREEPEETLHSEAESSREACQAPQESLEDRLERSRDDCEKLEETAETGRDKPREGCEEPEETPEKGLGSSRESCEEPEETLEHGLENCREGCEESEETREDGLETAQESCDDPQETWEGRLESSMEGSEKAEEALENRLDDSRESCEEPQETREDGLESSAGCCEESEEAPEGKLESSRESHEKHEETLEDKLESFLRRCDGPEETLAGKIQSLRASCREAERALEDPEGVQECRAGAEETLEDKLESFLREEELSAQLLSGSAASAPAGGAPPPGAAAAAEAAPAGAVPPSGTDSPGFSREADPSAAPAGATPLSGAEAAGSSRDVDLSVQLPASAAGFTPSGPIHSPGLPAAAAAPDDDAATDIEPEDAEPQDLPTPEFDLSDEEPAASLADMATVALQLEAMRALMVVDRTHIEELPTTDAPAGDASRSTAGSTEPAATMAMEGGASAATSGGVGAETAMVSAKRWELQRTIFRHLDRDGDGRLGCAELMGFAQLTGFDGSGEDWAEEFKDLCVAHAGGDEAGPTLPCFRAMLNDTSDDGFYCTDKELKGVHAKLERLAKYGPEVSAKPPPPPPDLAPEEPPPSVLAIPPELLGPGPRRASQEPLALLPEASPPREEEAVPLGALTLVAAEEGGVPDLGSFGTGNNDAPGQVYDLSKMHRRDEPEVLDVEELMQNVWDAREADGEKLGDSEDEEGEEEVETWGEFEPPPTEVGRAELVLQVEREAVTEVGTEVATEDVTEVPEVVASKHSPKMALPAGHNMPTVLRDESTLLDDLLVQVGVPHLAERGTAKQTHKRPAPQEATGVRPCPAASERPAKAARRGALRSGSGGAVAPVPTSAAQAQALQALKSELRQLGTREAMRDRRAIPELAARIASVHMPAIGAARVLSTMAATFVMQDVARPHKLAILYVFHEMLLANAHKTEFVSDSVKHFLQAVGKTIANLQPDKIGPFVKLLGMWKHVFTDRFLTHLREAWTSVIRAGAKRQPPGSPRA